MNTEKISPDDPRLTLFALHEMEPAERAGFEKLLAADPAARQAVEEIRAMAATVTTALEQEPMAAHAPARPAAKILRFPQLYFIVSGLAAACFAVVFFLQEEKPHARKQYLEVKLQQEDDAKVKAVQVAIDEEKKREAERHSSISMQLPVAESAFAPAPAPAPDPMSVAVAEAPALTAVPSSVPLDAVEGASSTLSGGQDRNQAALATKDLFNQAGPGHYANLDAVKSAPAPDMSFSNVSPISPALPVVPSPAPTGPEMMVLGNVTASTPARSEETLTLDAFVVTATPSRRGGGGGKADVRRNARPAPIERPELLARRPQPNFNTEAYAFRKDNAFLRVADQPLSTFSVDVDTASYANIRRMIQAGQRPPTDAVRIEELVNYFPSGDRPPAGDAPFAANLEVAGAPWALQHRLVRINLKGRELSDASRPAANLVFLVDVSGSMQPANKLPLVQQSLRLLVNKLRPDDRVAIAVYAGASGLALPSTPAARKADILEAIDRLSAGGSTNGGMGIQLAYDIAKANFIPGGVNRVILATDGDFNVGVTSEGELVRLVEEKAKSGVFLSVLGYGMGNLKDSTLEQLADKGNGNYAYIDSLAEARKTLVEQAGGTLVTIAKDVKLQVEFNPAVVQAYRLIGYENRLLAKEDFNNDKVDAGEIGAGHTVTALYEVVPVGVEMPATGGVDALKYQKVSTGATATSPSKSRGEVAAAPEMLTVKIRYKEPAGDRSKLLEFPLRDTGAAFASASQDFKFAAAVAAFGMVLRDSPHKGTATLADVVTWGREGLGSDTGGYRSEFIGLVERAQALLQ